MSMYEIFDEFCWTKQKRLITAQQHHMPGLGNFEYYNYSASGNPSPLHCHANIIEIHCMIKGNRYTHVEDSGRFVLYTSTGNQAFLTFPMELHSNGNEPLAPCEFYALQLDISKPDRMFGLNSEYSRRLVDTVCSLNRHLLLTPQVRELIQRAFWQFSEFSEQGYIMGSQYITAFLFSLPSLERVSDRAVAPIDSSIKNAVDYLAENMHERVTLTDLAGAAGYSLSRFKVRFKEELGVTPAEYVTWQKIELARKLLSQTKLPVTDIAFELGFSSSNYFSTVFRKLMNCTPQSYRKRGLAVKAAR